MKKISFFLLFCFLFSCSNKNGTNTVMGLFPEMHSSIEKEVTMEFDSIRNPYMIACVKGTLLLADIFQPTFMTAFDEETGKYMGNFLTKGNGPGEFIHLLSMQKVGEKLFVWDSGSSNIGIIDINKDSIGSYTSELIPLRQDSTFISAFQVFPLNENYFVSSGVIKGNRFAILDNQGKAISFFGEYPESDSGKEKSDVELALSNQCSYAYQSEKHILAVANGMGENIQFYNLSDIRSPQLIKEYNYSSPRYNVDEDGSVAFQKENIIGFTELLSSSKYCIGFFLGEALKDPRGYGSNKLLFFDWDGNPVKATLLSNTYSNITINEEENKVYLLGKDSKTADFKIYAADIE